MMQLLVKPFNKEGGFDLIEKARQLYSNHKQFHNGDAGLDLFCLQTQVIQANSRSVEIKLGIAVAGYCNDKPCTVLLYPRSSTGCATPIRLSNSVGIIDSTYRGELKAFVDNLSDKPFTLEEGNRYFQLCSPTYSSITMKVVKELDETSRGTGGFGSTNN